MTLDKIIKSISNKLLDSELRTEFIYVTKISTIEDERAYNLGLFFNKLRKDHFETIIALKVELEYLRDYYDNKKLKDFFLLKTSKIVSTKLGIWTFPLLVFGLVLIILGSIRQYQGLYKATVGTKLMPVYHTGLLYVIVGLALVWAGIAQIRQRKKYKVFYKKYNVGTIPKTK